MFDDDFEEEMANKEYDRLKNDDIEMAKLTWNAFDWSYNQASKQYKDSVMRGN